MSPVDLGSYCHRQRERSLQISGMGPACVLENSEETSRAGAGGAAQDERVESWMEPRTSPPAGGNHISQQTGESRGLQPWRHGQGGCEMLGPRGHPGATHALPRSPRAEGDGGARYSMGDGTWLVQWGEGNRVSGVRGTVAAESSLPQVGPSASRPLWLPRPRRQDLETLRTKDTSTDKIINNIRQRHRALHPELGSSESEQSTGQSERITARGCRVSWACVGLWGSLCVGQEGIGRS